jgi:hypothetical protein
MLLSHNAQPDGFIDLGVIPTKNSSPDRAGQNVSPVAAKPTGEDSSSDEEQGDDSIEVCVILSASNFQGFF